MRKHPARTPSVYKNSVPREVRGELQALTVSQPRCEGLSLQSLGLLVQERHVIIDPLLCGVDTDLFTPLGLEAVERDGILEVMLRTSPLGPQTLTTLAP